MSTKLEQETITFAVGTAQATLALTLTGLVLFSFLKFKALQTK